MTRDQFLHTIRQELMEFDEYCESNYPEMQDLSEGDWLEQFTIFCEAEVPE